MPGVRLQMATISQAELQINNLYQHGLILEDKTKNLIKRLSRLYTTYCQEFDDIVEEVDSIFN